MKRLSEDVRKAVLSSAAAEAHRLGDRRIGTHHLLLGLLHDPVSSSRQILDTDLARTREALTVLDREALAAIGVDAAPLDRTFAPAAGRRPPLTSGARSTLHRAVIRCREEGASRIEERHLLGALLELRPPDPAADLLVALGVDPVAASRLLDRRRSA